MRVRSFEELMLLPQELAVSRHLDGVTWTRGRWFLGAYLFAATVAAIVFASTSADFRLWIALGDLALLVAFFLLRKSRVVEGTFRPVVAGLLAAQFVTTILWSTDPAPVLVFAILPFPIVLLLLRLRPAEAAFVVATLVAGTAGWFLAHDTTVTRAALLGLAVAVPGVLAAVGASRMALRERKEFSTRWHRAVAREKERLRLRGELADARKIQLSMLPAGEPMIDWLELSGTCLPAAEVGGDYYDYIPLSDDAWAVVVADVAGHGVGSGLLIAGLRSSLYVLQDELRSPAAVLERLNQMIQASVRVRTFVTLTIAVVERSPGRLRVASAGHPPTFLRRASDGAVIEVGLPAPPLGTRLPTRYEEQTVDLAAGDLVLLYTDGLVEATDFRTEAYGFGRLERAFGRAASGSPRTGRARAIRTLILEDVSHFKGENYQADDLSLVVVRFDPGPEAHVPREALEAAPPAAGSSERVPLGEATDPRSSGSDG
jgi:serine phosphatase RsbU (regulator of sigma subunit)